MANIQSSVNKVLGMSAAAATAFKVKLEHRQRQAMEKLKEQQQAKQAQKRKRYDYYIYAYGKKTNLNTYGKEMQKYLKKNLKAQIIKEEIKDGK